MNSSAVVATSGYWIVSPTTRREVTMPQLLARLASADIVFFGEQHDDPETHRVEFETLKAIATLGRPVVLSLEMFERDVQPALDDYLSARITEPEFLAPIAPESGVADFVIFTRRPAH
ncbi:MAG: ChaN family lipoprotein [Gemmatimonadota bacterium]|nr:ChaN family lipoprotein [Gemmatimonadota bacterium]